MSAGRPPGALPSRVMLTFFKDAHRQLKDIVFETREGASNGTGRCMREIAWAYPWKEGEVPDTLELSPPVARPAGWVVLAYVSLLSELSYSPSRGVLTPGPLVRACLENGSGARPQLRYRVQTGPVRVSSFTEVSAPDQPGARQSVTATPVTDSERCVAAVLGSTVYAGTRNFEFDFSDPQRIPDFAPVSEVSAYFPPFSVPVAPNPLNPEKVKEAMTSSASPRSRSA